ncbi:hypothetical protein HW561_07915 [Rhodobacteraceae bacterium B1Z28]|uniref:Phytanoyl-CoA dioxygenase PhyH n=1 Tax=Ruegeria haliotis TaxID=2747601 RepID=A0ABX2PR73_9RHOB|nr:hypothetical protein [Ruegeria haliotis]NVO55712.1 hypothetical protein [Ruegeria haliotis]
MSDFWTRGWVKFPHDPVLAEWVSHAFPAAQASITDPAHVEWMDCEDTWFIGVDALSNDAQGRVGQSGPLTGLAMGFIAEHCGELPLHKGQVSVIYPGYPRPRRGENEAAARYRRNRDAAHVDGLRPLGPDRRRRVDEPHAWVLGIPLTDTSEDAAPMVVWEGSHILLRTAFERALANHPRETLHEVDITDIYQSARREVFETCPRVELPAKPGEAYLLHRHCLHGVAPWGADAIAGSDGRMIAYFRPECAGGVAEWIESP